MTPTQGRLWRVALSGSQTWPIKRKESIWEPLDKQLWRLRPGDTFIFRWGQAKRGVDRIGQLWFENARKIGPPGVSLVAEPVPADWSGPCIAEPYRDVRGNRVDACPDDPGHRKPNAGGRHGDGDTYCPRKGQLRNIEIPAHPDFPVNAFLAFCIDDSSGTTKTVEHAVRYRVPRNIVAIYS